MTLILETDTTQPESPIQTTVGLGYNQPMAPRMYDYLYSVETTQYRHPILQVLGWGYSEIPHYQPQPQNIHIPTWMTPDYPFVAPSEDVSEFITDILLSFDDPLGRIKAPIKLSRVTKHKEGLYSVRFTDADNNVVFESSSYDYTGDNATVTGNDYIEKATNQNGKCIYKHYDWGAVQDGATYFELLFWETDLVTLKMLIRRNTLTQFALYPDSAELDARALYQYPKRLRSITIDNGKTKAIESKITPPYSDKHTTSGSGVITGGKISFVPGYNMELECEDNSKRRTSHIVEFSAIKGAGLGKARVKCTGTDADFYLTSINGIGADENGSFFINGDACHTIRSTTFIKLDNSCTPCCRCEDMTKFGKLLKMVEDQYYCIGGEYRVAALAFNKAVLALKKRIEEDKKESTPVEYVAAEINHQFLRFRFVFRNLTSGCVLNLAATFRQSPIGSYNYLTMRMYDVHKTEPTDKPYSDCYLIDESDEPIYSDAMTVTWDKPIAAGEQVYLQGYWKFDPYIFPPKTNIKGERLYKKSDGTETTDANDGEPIYLCRLAYTELASVTYTTEDDKTVSVDLSEIPRSYGFTFCKPDFEDFTKMNSEQLEDEIRIKCIKEHWDEQNMVNTDPPDELIEEHRFDPPLPHIRKRYQ